jgi:hypothetical protein
MLARIARTTGDSFSVIPRNWPANSSL